MREFSSETDIAQSIVAWLRDQHYEIYQEVRPGRGSHIADIVAVQGAMTVVVETKLSFGFRVIDQAYYWSHWSNLVYVGVPYAKSRLGISATHLMRSLGIGLLRVEEHGEVIHALPAEFNRPDRRFFRLKDYLVEQQKTECAAGVPGGGYWTPFKETCNNLREYVGKHPGCSLRDAVKSIDTHYSKVTTAYVCLAKWITLGKVPGVRRGPHKAGLSLIDEAAQGKGQR